MSFIAPDVVAKAKQMDLLTYLSTYEPQELIHFGGGAYCTREHDSLKISNGKWYWFSRNIGGRSALDYLIKVKGIPFTEAVEEIVGRSTDQPVISPPAREPPKRTLLLPEACRSSTRAANYLVGRGIDNEMIDFCISTGRLYESEKYHNVVFIGQDSSGKPRYTPLRIAETMREMARTTFSPATPYRRIAKIQRGLNTNVAEMSSNRKIKIALAVFACFVANSRNLFMLSHSLAFVCQENRA